MPIDKASATAVSAMRNACHDILFSLVNSSLVDGVQTGTPTWKIIMYSVDAAGIALAVILEIGYLVRLKKKKY